jgi:transcriptional regulator with XRE-family HTH domain
MFAERLKQLRIDRDITQAELANLLGISPQAVYKYENGIVTNIPLDKIQVLADFFLVSPAYLAGWDNDPSPKSEMADLADQVANLPECELKRISDFMEVAGDLTDDQFEKVMAFAKFVAAEK